MVRAVVVSLAVLTLAAADFTGIIKEIDADKLTITLTVDEKDQTYQIDEKVFVYPIRTGQSEVEGGLKGLKPGDYVRIFTDKRGDVEVVTQIGLFKQPPSKKGRDRRIP